MVTHPVVRISCTCPECTDGQRGSRTQQRPEPPMQCRIARCSDSQRDPGQMKCKISSSSINVGMIKVEPDQREQPHTARPETFGSRFSWGTSTSSIRIMPVADARSENFPSILGVDKPFIPRSKMKPRTLPSSHLAHTTAMSATGEFVILGEDGAGNT